MNDFYRCLESDIEKIQGHSEYYYSRIFESVHLSSFNKSDFLLLKMGDFLMLLFKYARFFTPLHPIYIYIYIYIFHWFHQCRLYRR